MARDKTSRVAQYFTIEKAVQSYRDTKLDEHVPSSFSGNPYADNLARKFFQKEKIRTYRDLLLYVARKSWPTRAVEGAEYGIRDVLRRRNGLGPKTVNCIFESIQSKGLLPTFEPHPDYVPVDFHP